MGAEMKGQLPLFGNEPVGGDALRITSSTWRAYHPKRLFCDQCLADRQHGHDGRIFKAHWVLTTDDGQELLCSMHAEDRRTTQAMQARRPQQ
jgi:hypothetical protein